MDTWKQERLQTLQEIEEALKTARGAQKLGLLAEARCLFEVLLEGRSWVDALRALDAVREPAPKNTEKGYEGSVLQVIEKELADDPDFVVVLAKLKERAQFGLQKYGTYLHPNNGRDAREDLRAEMLDALMYATQLFMEDGSWESERKKDAWIERVRREYRG